MVFEIPNPLNLASAWGPDLSIVPQRFEEIPYAPYSKAEKLGRVADWYEAEGMEPAKDTRRHDRKQRGQAAGIQDAAQAASSAFSYVHAEDESSFSLVDRVAPSTGVRQAMKRPQATGGAWGSRPAPKGTATQGGQRQQYQQRNGGRRGMMSNAPRVIRESSVAVGANWTLCEEYQLAAFLKLNSSVNAPQDIESYGVAHYYDRVYDRVSTKFEKPLRATSRSYANVNASEDTIMQSIAGKGELPNGKTLEGDIVFASAQLIAGLMTAPRSVYSWDIVVTKKQQKDANGKIRNVVFLDKRQGSLWDYLTVNETAAEAPSEENAAALAAEAADIQCSFLQQLVKPNGKTSFAKPSPFGSEKTTVPVGYRYRMWDMRAQTSSEDQKPITLIARTEVHASSPATGADKPTLYSLYALNECFPVDPDSGALQSNYIDWRSKLDLQRGAVLANELRNNAWKLARWTVESILGDIDQMKLGFVTRTVPANPARGHLLLGTQFYKPTEFASQMSLDMQQCWGVIKSLVDIFVNRDDGMYLLLKDPNEPKVKLYELPEGTKLSGYGAEEDDNEI